MTSGRFARALLLVNCLVPVSLLGFDAITGRLAANPVNDAIRTTGLLALIFLTLSLAVTPLSRLTGWSQVVPARRILGLCAFFHALLHFLLFFGLDRSGSVSGTVSEIVKRPYLGIGLTSLVLVVPLAATSTNAMIARLGPRRWKALHRLAYVAGVAGVAHFYLLVKADVSRPLTFAVIIGGLLGYRVVAYLAGRRSPAGAVARNSAVTPAAAVAARPRTWKGRLRVARVSEETPTVRTFRLEPESGDVLPFDYAPGQFLNVALPVGASTVRRSYTIASSPTRAGHCEITVKREPMGLSSGHLHESVQEGTWIDVIAPAGRFTFTGDEAASIVLIAGGVGITPLMSKVRYLTDRRWPGDIFLVAAFKNESEIIFRRELAQLAELHPKLHLTITLTREPGDGWTGERGRISAELLLRAVPDLASRRIHVCGPTSMMDEVVATLQSLGVAPTQIHTESFVSDAPVESAPAAVAESAGPEPSVEHPPATVNVGANGETQAGGQLTFRKSGRVVQVDAETTVLEAADNLGLDLPNDCRAGVCGTCRTKKISGEVVMDYDEALSPSERAKGTILACQARCVGDVVVDA